MESKILGVRLDSNTWDKLEREAEQKNTTISELVRQKIAQSLEYDTHIQQFVNELINRLHVSQSEFYEILLYDFMARFDAEIKVYGGPLYTLIPFFKTPEGNVSLGDELYNELITNYVWRYTQIKKKRLLEQESAGEEISPEDKRFLIAHRAGQAWLKSEKYAREANLFKKYKALGQEAKAKGLVPKELSIPDIQLGKIYEDVVNKSISEEEFIDKIHEPFFVSFYNINKFNKLKKDKDE